MRSRHLSVEQRQVYLERVRLQRDIRRSTRRLFELQQTCPHGDETVRQIRRGNAGRTVVTNCNLCGKHLGSVLVPPDGPGVDAPLVAG